MPTCAEQLLKSLPCFSRSGVSGRTIRACRSCQVFADVPPAVIRDTVPKIINLLKDQDAKVRSTAAEVFAILFEKRESMDNLSSSPLPSVFADVFSDVIRDAVPRIINLLNDPDANVRSTAAKTIAKVPEQRELRDNLCLLPF